MASIKRQITDVEKQQVLQQQKRNGVLYCFAEDHPIDDETDVEFHHIKPHSEDGPSDPANIGAVCKVLAAAINSTVMAGENPTVGSTVWLPAESVAPGR